MIDVTHPYPPDLDRQPFGVIPGAHTECELEGRPDSHLSVERAPAPRPSGRAIEQRARRVLLRHGYRLMKLRSNSRWYDGYGPYLVVDAYQNAIVAWSFPDPSAAVDWLLPDDRSVAA